MLTIRNEREADWEEVEAVTRRAFYNQYMPGCCEHYLVHIMRGHEDFLPQLDFVAELDGRIIGNIMYTRAWLTDRAGREKEILTFGPVSILPEHQRKGYGKQLIRRSLERAAELGYDTVVIFGSPANYVGLGFQSCRKHGISLEDGSCPAAMMVKPLEEGALDGRKWVYRGSPVMQVDEQAAARFDAALEPMEKGWRPSQEEFYILSHATVADPER